MKNLLIAQIINWSIKGNVLAEKMLPQISTKALLSFNNKMQIQKEKERKKENIFSHSNVKDLTELALMCNNDYLLDFCLENNLSFDLMYKNKGWMKKMQNVFHYPSKENANALIKKIEKIELKTNKKVELSIGYESTSDFFNRSFHNERDLDDFFLFVLERSNRDNDVNCADELLILFSKGSDKLKNFLTENLTEKTISNLIATCVYSTKINQIEFIKQIKSCKNYNGGVFLNNNCIIFDLSGIYEYSLKEKLPQLEQKIIHNDIVFFIKSSIEEINIKETKNKLDNSFLNPNKVKKIKM